VANKWTSAIHMNKRYSLLNAFVCLASNDGNEVTDFWSDSHYTTHDAVGPKHSQVPEATHEHSRAAASVARRT